LRESTHTIELLTCIRTSIEGYIKQSFIGNIANLNYIKFYKRNVSFKHSALNWVKE